MYKDIKSHASECLFNAFLSDWVLNRTRLVFFFLNRVECSGDRLGLAGDCKVMVVYKLVGNGGWAESKVFYERWFVIIRIPSKIQWNLL